MAIPDDIIHEVLKKVPPKERCRFKILSKQHKVFIEEEDQKSSANSILTNVIVLGDSAPVKVFSVNTSGEAKLLIEIEESLKIANGLMCFRTEESKMMILNPSRGNSMVFEVDFNDHFEFGFDVDDETYKILLWDKDCTFRVITVPENEEHSPVSRSVANGLRLEFLPEDSVNADSSIFWYGEDYMVRFYLRTETFTMINLPPEVIPSSRFFKLEFGRKLCMFDRVGKDELWMFANPDLGVGSTTIIG